MAGESTNYGPEQERLNNVIGARLHITALRAATGRVSSSSRYLSPRNGRPAVGIEGDDLAHWETTMTSAHADAAFTELQQSGALFVAPSVATLPDDPRFMKAILIRDPDGHGLRLVVR